LVQPLPLAEAEELEPLELEPLELLPLLLEPPLLALPQLARIIVNRRSPLKSANDPRVRLNSFIVESVLSTFTACAVNQSWKLIIT
jgi:hypothetical protein